MRSRLSARRRRRRRRAARPGATRTSCSEGSTRMPLCEKARDGTSRSGTMIGVMPAASAPRTPGSESSSTTHAFASTSSRAAASAKMSGAGLPRTISSPPTSTAKCASKLGHRELRLRPRPTRRRCHRLGDMPRIEPGEKLGEAGLPRDRPRARRSRRRRRAMPASARRRESRRHGERASSARQSRELRPTCAESSARSNVDAERLRGDGPGARREGLRVQHEPVHVEDHGGGTPCGTRRARIRRAVRRGTRKSGRCAIRPARARRARGRLRRRARRPHPAPALPGRFRSRRTISCTCSFAALPCPTTACFTCSAVYSATGRRASTAAEIAAPRA